MSLSLVEVAALWLVVLVLYFCVIMGAVFWSCKSSTEAWVRMAKL